MLYVWNWFIAFSHTKEGFSKYPFLTIYWLFKPEILDEIGNVKRKNAIVILMLSLLVLTTWGIIV